MSFNINEWKPLDDIIKLSRKTVRTLVDKHYEAINHDEKRKINEIQFFMGLFRFITRKWNVEILYELENHKELRFNKLRRHLGNISTRTLSDSLKQLSKNQFIEREVQDTSPPSVVYRLSEKGRGFVELSMVLMFYLAKIRLE